MVFIVEAGEVLKGGLVKIREEEGHQRSRQWHPTPGLLPGESLQEEPGRGSLVGCSPWGRLESDTTERLHFHFSLSCIGKGNGNPLQCSCLENPRDGAAWWAAIYRAAQSWTRLKRLSSSRAIKGPTSHLLSALPLSGIDMLRLTSNVN